MKTSQAGKDLIKKYEGLRLKAYKPVKEEKYWTIGYGHYGPDVKESMTITQAQADAYLDGDLATAERAVSKYDNIYHWRQPEFDSLVSFTYNCGAGNLKTLLQNGRRSIAEISRSIPAYNKGSGRVLSGLVKRRAEEKKLFDSAARRLTIRKGDKGEPVKDLQRILIERGYDHIIPQITGVFCDKTDAAVRAFQNNNNLKADGIVGPLTWEALTK